MKKQEVTGYVYPCETKGLFVKIKGFIQLRVSAEIEEDYICWCEADGLSSETCKPIKVKITVEEV